MEKRQLVSAAALHYSTKMKSEFRHWSDIRVFLAVLRAGSTLAASKLLGMSQPTVARRIEVLEHETGLLLFDRNTRGFQPTEAALSLKAQAEMLEAAAIEFASKAQSFSKSRPIRITATSANFTTSVTEIFDAFSAIYPEIDFIFLPNANYLDLSAGEADIAIRLAWQEQDPDLICRHISDAQFTLYGAPTYAEKHGLPDSVEEMDKHVYIVHNPGNKPSPFSKWIQERTPARTIKRTISELPLLLPAIMSGQVLGILNLRMVENEEKEGSLIRCFEPPKELDVPQVMLVTPEAHKRPEVKAFTKFFAPRYAALFRDTDE